MSELWVSSRESVENSTIAKPDRCGFWGATGLIIQLGTGLCTLSVNCRSCGSAAVRIFVLVSYAGEAVKLFTSADQSPSGYGDSMDLERRLPRRSATAVPTLPSRTDVMPRGHAGC